MVLLIFTGIGFNVHAQANGKDLFKANCRSCHAMDKHMVGPALDGAFDRIRQAKGTDEAATTGWMKSWIKNSAQLIADGDDYAMQVFADNNKVQMTAFVSLADQELDALIDYVRFWNDPVKYPIEIAQVPVSEAPSDKGFLEANTLLIILVIALLIIALILMRLTRALSRLNDAREGIELSPEEPFFKTRKFHILILMMAVIFVAYKTVDGAISLGRQQNYSPEQPIAFSHALHAGINQIDCKYCHIGVERGKQATIPSVNICMNCHKAIQQGPTGDTTQIAKIYRAAGYNRLLQTYDNSKAKPIEWIRIHNLPDHVYFNHEQHVKVGQLQCQTCHGQVQEMDQVKQFATLSMGWCLDCHRNHKVQFNKGEYYKENYKDYHEQLLNGDIQEVTVEMIGGTECQQCHF